MTFNYFGDQAENNVGMEKIDNLSDGRRVQPPRSAVTVQSGTLTRRDVFVA